MSELPTQNRVAQAGGAMTRRSSGPESLADVIDRVLDKGVVVIGDIAISILDIELLTLRVRLLIASANTAREMGIDWWTADPYYSSDARRKQDELEALRERVAELENANDESKKSNGGAATSSRQRQRGGAS
jgi:Gas vesicle protein